MNLVPLIDILLVILIFLMVTTTYSRFSELKINLPSAQGEVNHSVIKKLEIDIDISGHYAINQRAVRFLNSESFSKILQEAAGNTKDPIIVINADGNATHQSVINVMEAARLAGYTHVTFETKQK